MQRKTFLSTSLVLMLIAFSSISWVSPQLKSGPEPVTITAVFNGGSFPNLTGSFSTTGALNISGMTTMEIGPNKNGNRAHCEIILYPAGGGSITIHQECVFSTPIPQGRWEIVGGTGAYANLKGNGSLTMPPATEAMTGELYL